MRPRPRKPASAAPNGCCSLVRGIFGPHTADCVNATPSDRVCAHLERVAIAQERIAAAAEAQRDMGERVAAFILDQAKKHAAALGLELDELPAVFRGEPKN